MCPRKLRSFKKSVNLKIISVVIFTPVPYNRRGKHAEQREYLPHRAEVLQEGHPVTFLDAGDPIIRGLQGDLETSP
jgi:hypothetical protein